MKSLYGTSQPSLLKRVLSECNWIPTQSSQPTSTEGQEDIEALWHQQIHQEVLRPSAIRSVWDNFPNTLGKIVCSFGQGELAIKRLIPSARPRFASMLLKCSKMYSETESIKRVILFPDGCCTRPDLCCTRDSNRQVTAIGLHSHHLFKALSLLLKKHLKPQGLEGLPPTLNKQSLYWQHQNGLPEISEPIFNLAWNLAQSFNPTSTLSDFSLHNPWEFARYVMRKAEALKAPKKAFEGFWQGEGHCYHAQVFVPSKQFRAFPAMAVWMNRIMVSTQSTFNPKNIPNSRQKGSCLMRIIMCLVRCLFV